MKSDDILVGLHVLEKPLAFPHPSPADGLLLCNTVALLTSIV